jgi:hypothetical protein
MNRSHLGFHPLPSDAQLHLQETAWIRRYNRNRSRFLHLLHLPIQYIDGLAVVQQVVDAGGTATPVSLWHFAVLDAGDALEEVVRLGFYFLDIAHMTRRLVGNHVSNPVMKREFTVSQYLADISGSLDKSDCAFPPLRLVAKQMIVFDEHGPAPAGVVDDEVNIQGFKRLNILFREGAGLLQATGMGM